MLSTIDYYREALDIVADPDTDWRALVLQIAKTNPKALVEAKADPLRLEAIAAFKAGGKLQAIKHVRSLSGMGLLEAKEFVESVVDPKDAPEASA